MKKAKQIFVFAVGVLTVFMPAAAFATPYDSGTYDTGSYDGNAPSLSISSDGNVNVPLHPSGGATLATGSGHVTVTTDDVDGYKLYVRASGSAALNNTTTTSTQGNLTVDTSTYNDVNSNSTTNAKTGFSTTYANDLIVAFISTDGPNATGQTVVTGVSGGGLTWTAAVRNHTAKGEAAIYTAQASSILSNATITAGILSSGYMSSMSIFAFKDAHTGATGTNGATTGAPTVSLTTTDTKSMVYGVGHDWTSAIARTIGTGQTMFHDVGLSDGDESWVQYKTAAVPNSGTVVTLNDTAPTTDQYDFAAIEIIPNHVSGTTTLGTIAASSNTTAAALATNTWGYNTNASTSFVGMTTSDVLAHQDTAAATSGDTTTFTYGVNADNKVIPGAYSTTVVYTAVPAT